jgi:TRAP-type mannitol/chloroaromatic compound transport system substrate-binding protein
MGVVGGCQAANAPAPPAQEGEDTAKLPDLQWDMATSWPPSLDTIFGGAQTLAKRVAELTDGKFKISPRAAGELAPPLEVLDVVSQGAVPCGHTASYYYIGKSPALAFGTTLPFGLTAQQQNAWLYDGGGLAKLREIYAAKLNVIQFPAGNSGMQMGGWFRKEVSSLNDLKGLKMRIPGLGGQVMSKLGVTVQTLAGGEIFPALQTGAIDAAEWVGPYDDEKLALNKIAKFYYYPGWWEPGSTFELQINLDRWQQLPPLYKSVIATAAYEANATMLARYEARNNQALKRLLASGTQLRPYSEEILAAAEKAAFALYEGFAKQDPDFKAVFEQWRQFRQNIYAWNKLNEGSYTTFAYAKIEPEAAVKPENAGSKPENTGG